MAESTPRSGRFHIDHIVDVVEALATELGIPQPIVTRVLLEEFDLHPDFLSLDQDHPEQQSIYSENVDSVHFQNDWDEKSTSDTDSLNDQELSEPAKSPNENAMRSLIFRKMIAGEQRFHTPTAFETAFRSTLTEYHSQEEEQIGERSQQQQQQQQQPQSVNRRTAVERMLPATGRSKSTSVLHLKLPRRSPPANEGNVRSSTSASRYANQKLTGWATEEESDEDDVSSSPSTASIGINGGVYTPPKVVYVNNERSSKNRRTVLRNRDKGNQITHSSKKSTVTTKAVSNDNKLKKHETMDDRIERMRTLIRQYTYKMARIQANKRQSNDNEQESDRTPPTNHVNVKKQPSQQIIMPFASSPIVTTNLVTNSTLTVIISPPPTISHQPDSSNDKNQVQLQRSKPKYKRNNNNNNAELYPITTNNTPTKVLDADSYFVIQRKRRKKIESKWSLFRLSHHRLPFRKHSPRRVADRRHLYNDQLTSQSPQSYPNQEYKTLHTEKKHSALRRVNRSGKGPREAAGSNTIAEDNVDMYNNGGRASPSAVQLPQLEVRSVQLHAPRQNEMRASLDRLPLINVRSQSMCGHIKRND